MSIPPFAYPENGTIDAISQISQMRSLIFGIGTIA
jgi:hypothetical protein